MAQVFDMKRLHMGCGESLRRPLPTLVYGKRPLLPPPQGEPEHPGRAESANGKSRRDESR